MKIYRKTNRTGGRLLSLLTAAVLLVSAWPRAYAFDASHYAASSRLASGTWAKIAVKETGMQFVSNTQLSALGFKDPSKVNVYGFGGRMISETLSADMPDDLPLLPCVRTSKGLLFFGVDNIDWARTSSRSKMTWSHIQHPYDTGSYYFLSDRDAGDTGMKSMDGTPSGDAETLSTFVSRTLHEQELAAPSNTGRTLLGEDFRSPNTRSFDFTLTDNTGGDAVVKVAFGGLSTSGWTLTLRGQNGGSSTFTSNSAGTGFMQIGEIEQELPCEGEKFRVSLTFSPRGTVTLARLDYIEVEWERALRLHSGQLHIYDKMTKARNYSVAGCSPQTVVWDVTDPTAPALVRHRLNGDRVEFRAEGQREYIVFNPDGGLAVETAGGIDNQDIHSLPVPQMVIITPAEYMSASRRVAALHEAEGMTVHVLTPEAVYNEFSSGTADVSAFRKMLKMWQDRSGNPDRISYCLLMSKPSYDNKGLGEVGRNRKYPVVPIWQSPEGYSQSLSYSTDDFIGMIDDPRGDFRMDRERVTVAVGRFPVKSVAEADAMATKLESYVGSRDFGQWRTNAMFLADDGDNSDHLMQTEDAIKGMTATEHGSHLNYNRIYLDTYTLKYSGIGAVYPDAKRDMLNAIDDGVVYWNYIGHANPVFWGHENILTWQDMSGMRNKRLPVLYAATCEYARWDSDDLSGGEAMWLNEHGGVINMICPSRSVYISMNGNLTREFGKYVFAKDSEGRLMRLGEALVRAKQAYMPGGSTNNYRYCFLGDPALRLLVPEHRVTLDSIAGISLDGIADMADAPVIKARQRVEVSGSVVDDEGKTLTGFNGEINLMLTDAEKPVTTNGNNGSGGDRDQVTFNARTTRLYTGRTAVKDGRWSTVILMPYDIEDNFSPARLTMYAFSEDTGEEASGSSEKFYVYGFDDTVAEDKTGPDISLFAINREDFADGGLTHATPIVLARFSDESGINLSDAGIGHKITLVLDNDKVFTDVGQYYTADSFDITAGSIVYPMSELGPGEHKLKLTVWDNANNSSSRELTFNVSVSKQPEIFHIGTDVNPARTSVVFTVSTDRALSSLGCTFEVFDLQGRCVWSGESDAGTDFDSSISMQWDLKGNDGARVPRGIYLYRATVSTPEGTETTATSKLAVTAP